MSLRCDIDCSLARVWLGMEPDRCIALHPPDVHTALDLEGVLQYSPSFGQVIVDDLFLPTVDSKDYTSEQKPQAVYEFPLW